MDQCLAPQTTRPPPVTPFSTEILFDLVFTIDIIAGKEFYNAKVKALMNEHEITMFSTNNHEIKAGMVERLIRTIRSRMARLFRSRGTKKYWDALPDIMRVYNQTEHSSHEMAPDDVKEDNSLKVFNALYKKLLTEKKPRPSFKVGDKVRVYIDKSLFKKGYMPNYGDEVCKIHKVFCQRPEPVYLVETSQGVLDKRFYEKELSKVL
jgi:hypothetical protein